MIKYWAIILVIVSSIMTTYIYANPGNNKGDRILRYIGYFASWFIFVGIICTFIFLNWKWGLLSILLAQISYSWARH